mmetsp:Transcript_12523/g.25879  ORF Transcript_12523/g.25879 Transcript_12523/m.25879 type:complete len:224 (-) Transcript_12523:96-767(-)
MNNLEAGSDAGTTSNETKVIGMAALQRFAHLLDGEVASSKVRQMTLGSLHLNAVTNAKRIEMLTHFASIGELGVDAGLVYFDNKCNGTGSLVASYRGVTALMRLTSRIGEAQGNVLSNGKAQSSGGRLQTKGETASVVTNNFLLDQLKVLEFVGLHGRFAAAEDIPLECDCQCYGKDSGKQCQHDSLWLSRERRLHRCLYSCGRHYTFGGGVYGLSLQGNALL